MLLDQTFFVIALCKNQINSQSSQEISISHKKHITINFISIICYLQIECKKTQQQTERDNSHNQFTMDQQLFHHEQVFPKKYRYKSELKAIQKPKFQGHIRIYNLQNQLDKLFY
ncbi:hypothetical protein ABPG74_017182 [Tetrahymena malaccensis]